MKTINSLLEDVSVGGMCTIICCCTPDYQLVIVEVLPNGYEEELLVDTRILDNLGHKGYEEGSTFQFPRRQQVTNVSAYKKRAV